MTSSKLNRFILALAIATISSLLFVFPVRAATQTFRWQGEKGYTVQGKLEYDDERSQLISQRGGGHTEGLQSLQVSFYDPDGRLIDRYNNVTNGVARGNYFEFHYDPKTQSLMGNIDLGGEFAGETYLKGTSDRELSLIRVEPSGEELIVDRDFSQATIED